MTKKLLRIKPRSPREADAMLHRHAVLPESQQPGIASGRRVYASRTGNKRKKTLFIPDELDRALRLHCVTADTDETKTVIAALKAYLGLE